MPIIGGSSAVHTAMLNQTPRFCTQRIQANSSVPQANQRMVLTLSSMLGCAGTLVLLAGLGKFLSSGGLRAMADALKKPYGTETGFLEKAMIPLKWICDGIAATGRKIAALFSRCRDGSCNS